MFNDKTYDDKSKMNFLRSIKTEMSIIIATGLRVADAKRE